MLLHVEPPGVKTPGVSESGKLAGRKDLLQEFTCRETAIHDKPSAAACEGLERAGRTATGQHQNQRRCQGIRHVYGCSERLYDRPSILTIVCAYFTTSFPDGLKPRSRCLPQVVDRFSQCPRHPTPYPHHLAVQARATPHHRNPLPHHHNPLSHPRNLTHPRDPLTQLRGPPHPRHTALQVRRLNPTTTHPWHHLRQNSRNLSPKNSATMPGSSTQRGSLGCSRID
jgi:hypothetical protein